MSWLKKFYAKLTYLVGDTHVTSRFPWVSWSHKRHLVDYDELLEALPLVQFGDVGLHRDAGYLSNAFIPGFMKHAWIHVQDDPQRPQVVEAVSEGVLLRNAIVPLFSDYSMILSPLNVSDAERKGACLKARRVVGVDYDPFFDFNIEDELKFYTGKDTAAAQADAKSRERNVYSYSFSCTEVVSYAWWHKREELRIFRKRHMGKDIILADDFINGDWKIKWLSQSVTVDAAHRLGLQEEGVEMIRAYWREK